MFRRSILPRLVRYGSSLLLLWLAIAVYQYGSYYVNYLSPEAKRTLVLMAAAYSLGGLAYYTLVPIARLPDNKAYIVLRTAYRLIRQPTADASGKFALQRHEKIAALFLLVKFFFLPIMINSLFGNYQASDQYFNSFTSVAWPISVASFNAVVFPVLFYLFFLLDTLIFTIGYSTESTLLKNRVRSVDMTTSGWLLCLICYPPFNAVLSNYIAWPASETNQFGTAWLNCLMHGVVLGLMAVYVAASVALGTRASNLTNRGIVGSGPYRWVRHPAYASKTLSWWLMMLPVISPAAILSLSVWTAIYYGRAVTEERHLGQDADYQAYCRQVPARFIPQLRLFDNRGV